MERAEVPPVLSRREESGGDFGIRGLQGGAGEIWGVGYAGGIGFKFFVQGHREPLFNCIPSVHPLQRSVLCNS